MADRDDRPTLPLDHEPLNREERRRAASGRAGLGRAAGEGGEAADADAVRDRPAPGTPGTGASAGRPDQDVTRRTGAGAGGATESGGRLTHHEGIHLPSRPNG